MCHAGGVSRWPPRPSARSACPRGWITTPMRRVSPNSCGARAAATPTCSTPRWEPASARESSWTARSFTGAPAGGREQIRTEHVGQAVREGDAVARQVLEETAFLLTVWLGNIVDLLEPECMVVGGGVAELMSPFFADISKNLPRWAINQRAGEIPLVMARYGADAGIAGAAALCG